MAVEGDFDFLGGGVVHPEVGEAVAFVADEDGGGAGHVGVPV